jgi:hypothetical protein
MLTIIDHQDLGLVAFHQSKDLSRVAFFSKHMQQGIGAIRGVGKVRQYGRRRNS